VSPRARGILFDLDGTLYEGGALIPGARETLEFCQHGGIPYRFVTNTTSKPRASVVENLRSLGIEAKPEWIFTAPAAAREILLERGLTHCHILMRPALMEDFAGIVMEEREPQAVVIGDMGEGFTFEKLNRAFRHLLDSRCAFVTLARNRFFQTGQGLSLDVGPFVAALEFATGRKAELAGKPSPAFFHTALRSMSLTPAEALMVGDDLESDALGAMAAGLKGALVRTGKFREAELASAAAKPNHILDSIASVPSLF